MKYLPVSQRQRYQRTSTNFQQNSNREAHPRAGAEPPQGRQRPSPGSFGDPSLPSSQPGGGLTAGEQSHGHGDDRDDNGNPQEPQQPLQEGLQGEVSSGGSRTGPTTCATRPEQGVPGAPLSRTHLHGAMEQRCEAAGGAAAAVLGSGARRGEGRRAKGLPRGPVKLLPPAGPASEQRWVLGARGGCRLQEASRGRRWGLSEITFFLLAPRGFSELWFRLRFKRCERGNRAIRWRGRTLDTERISVGKQITPTRRSQK